MDAVRRSTAFAYVVACASTAAVAAFRFLIGDYAGDQVTLLPFLLSVTIAARYGGLGPGLLATVLGAFASVALFLQPEQPFILGSVSDRIRLCVFLTIGAVISYLYSALLSARARAEASALDAIEKQQELEHADRNKNDFLATLAHEMRNPLAAIQTELVAAQLGELPASVRSSFDLLQRQAFVLTRLTADLFDLSTISRGKMRLTMKPVDLREQIRSAIETVRPALESHRHILELDLPEQPLFVTADATRLTQVFINLLANSIKYTDDGGHIRISACISQLHGVVRVIDNGVGIPAEHLSRLFELGEQVEKNIERSEGGLGIGLAVVRRLVEMHCGSVGAKSDGPGHGCEFTVRLPMASQNARSNGAVDSCSSVGAINCNCHHSPLNRLSPPRVLVVDDHGSIAKTCSAILRDYGCEARFATDAKSAIQVVDDFEPDIGLIDINMPGIDGYELARHIKSTPNGERTTLIAMTGAAGEREIRRCTEVGYTSCLVKPLNIDDLRRIAGHRMEAPDR